MLCLLQKRIEDTSQFCVPSVVVFTISQIKETGQKFNVVLNLRNSSGRKMAAAELSVLFLMGQLHVVATRPFSCPDSVFRTG